VPVGTEEFLRARDAGATSMRTASLTASDLDPS
jgi:hypothetical protein